MVHLVLEVLQGEPALVDGVQHERQHGLQPREPGRRCGTCLLLVEKSIINVEMDFVSI